MSRAPFYETVYHCNDWTLADAFRPQPGWGCRRFTVSTSGLEGVSESNLIAAAQEAAPEGYRLTSLSIYPAHGPERVIWSTPPSALFRKDQPNAALKEIS